jgi:DNA primase
MAIPEQFLQEIRERIDIAELIGAHVRLRKAGRNFKALCPFHTEKTPSFVVSRDRGIYRCFGCGASGNIFSFVMETQKIGFVDAVKVLASRAGMKVPATPGQAREERRNEKLYEALEFAAQQAEALLWNERGGARARKYLEGRGISEPTAREFRLGYADPSGDYLARKAKGLPVWESLVQTGMVLQDRARPRDMFRGRLVFPILNASGRVVGFGGRSLDGSEPKYLNSRESSIFKKGALLYGLWQARKALREGRSAVLVEGYMDVLALHQGGLTEAVASSGTALTEEQANILRRFSDSVLIAFDGDEAGQKAARRSLEILYSCGLDTRVAVLDEGTDPDSLVKRGGPEALREVLGRAPDAVEFTSRGYAGGGLAEREAVLRRIVSLLGVVSDPIKRQVLLRRASDLLGVREQVFLDGLKALRYRVGHGSDSTPAESDMGEIPQKEKELLRALLLAPELMGEVLEQFERSLLVDPASRGLFEIMMDAWNRGASLSASRLMDEVTDARMRALIGEVAVGWEVQDEDAAKAAYDCMRRLKEHRLRGRLETIKTQIREKEATGLHDEVNHLALQLQSVTAELKALSQRAT